METVQQQSVYTGVPDWGFETQTDLGAVRYYVDEPHNDQFVTDATMVVVNLRYDETDVSFNSDFLHRMCTPRDCVVTVPAGTEVHEISGHASEAFIFEVPDQQHQHLMEGCAPRNAEAMGICDDLIDPRIGNIGRLMRTAFFTGQNHDTLYIESLLADIQQLTFSSYYRHDLSTRTNRCKLSKVAITHLHDFMEAQLDNNLTLEQMASEVALSPYHFARAYKRTTGQSPYQALLDRRMTRARQYLSTPHCSLADIALMAGFSSQSHMTYIFRKALGVTPGQYRKFAID